MDVSSDGRWKSMEDYRGKWLVMFSHPADFTPVCTTEFIGFQSRKSDFDRLSCELLGLSIDSHYAHIAWVRSIKDSFGCTVQFPIIADLDMKVARSYGMVHPGASDTQAVRATFIIDPRGFLRAMLYYPMMAGRNVDEIVRLVTALTTADAHKVAMPENWQPGKPVIVPTPQTSDAAEARMTEGFDTVDWYFSTRDLAVAV
jgi:peroxiredoxin (alkyl hydroperoxide reductase subunit C)